MRFGYFLSSEEFTPAELIDQARMAEDAGFEALWISDHYHPWNDEQGESPFVWSVIGAISQVCSLPVTTAVTCPTFRIHPAIIAQAAATSAVLMDGKFVLGVGSGEALNEHILGDAWPSADVRLAMLEEAIELIRALFTGDVVDFDGRYYTVEHARLYTLPASPPPIYISAFGPKACDLAGRVGDGYCGTMPDAELLKAFREAGGNGKPTQGGLKVCYGPNAGEARKTAHRLWANSGLPGELSQVLPTPEHFMQASSLVTEESTGESITCGPDIEAHLDAIRPYIDAGYDEIYVNQIGPLQREFFDAYKREVLPALRG
jgi:G6PDH family F420-dependent oxidoreductase